MKKYSKKYFLNIIEKTCINFENVIKNVENKKSNLAILPIHNLITGSILEVYNLLQHTKLSIIGEIYLPINHCIIALPDTDVKNINTIYSHIQPLKQCSIFLNKFPHWKLKNTSSSSYAIENLSKKKTKISLL